MPPVTAAATDPLPTVAETPAPLTVAEIRVPVTLAVMLTVPPRRSLTVPSA
jgi:hypothetical protein